jgi:hypothetical protein
LRGLSLFVLAEALGAVIAEARLASAHAEGGGLAAALLYLAGLAVLHREASAVVFQSDHSERRTLES